MIVSTKESKNILIEQSNRQLAQEANETGEYISNKTKELCENLDQLSNCVNIMLNNMNKNSENEFVETQDITTVLKNIEDMKEEMESFVSFHENKTNLDILSMKNKELALENKEITLGFVINNSIRKLVENVKNDCNKLIDYVSKNSKAFYEETKNGIKNVCKKISTRMNDISKAYNEYLTTSMTFVRNNPLPEKSSQYSPIFDKIDKELEQIQTKIDNSKGFEKLYYKMAYNDLKNTGGRYAVNHDILAAREHFKEQTTKFKDDVVKEINKVKTKIQSKYEPFRNNIIATLINNLDKASDKMKDYASTKNIDLENSNPKKENVKLETKQNEIDEIDLD